MFLYVFMVMCSPQPCTARALGPFSPPSMAATWENPQEELGKTTNLVEQKHWKVNISWMFGVPNMYQE